jgi:hypothetical protein
MNYLIIKTSELGTVDFSQVLETSSETVRRSVDGTKTFIKWKGAQPAFVATLTETEGPYTNAELRAILNTDVWTSPDELP